MKRNDTKAVKYYLEKFGKLTSRKAISLFDATRLSSIIFNLRRKPYCMKIKTRMVRNEESGRRYGIYEFAK